MKIKKFSISYFSIFLAALFLTSFGITASAYAANIKSTDTNLIILFKDNVIDSDLEIFIEESEGEVINEFSDLGAIEVKCTPSLIPEILKYNTVESLAPNHPMKVMSQNRIQLSDISTYSRNTNEDYFHRYQWDIKIITNNGESFNIESGNHDVVIGIIDSGVESSHPDLEENFLGGKNLVPAGFNDDDSETGSIYDVEDRLGHGTEIAGAIAGNGKIKGVAPDIGFKSYRIMGSMGETNASIISSAIIEAVDDNVNVINLSLGAYDIKGKCYWTDPETGIEYKLGNSMAEYSLYKRAIRYAVDNNVVVVAAAGNESLDCSDKKGLTEYLNIENEYWGFRYEGLTYEIPGSIKNVITVAGTNIENELASYSNYGKNFIDISSPGGEFSLSGDDDEDIDAALEAMCFTTSLDGSYAFTDGTSIAAPKVSALAGLLFCKNPQMSSKDIAKKIYKTADKLNNDQTSEYYGAGLINAYKALTK